MKLLTSAAIGLVISIASTSVIAQDAKSLKQAKRATELRQSIFSLLGSNMGPLGGMAKGRIPLDAKQIEKYALRINQLSLMIADYTGTNTSGHKVETQALDKVWQQPEQFSKRISDLTKASANLKKVALTGDEAVIKKAIGGIGRTCGGCHDDFKKD
ncbi:MAG: cytochrome c [Colwellia sp.]|nr:cytochrome c [Colwellia sp.]